MIDDLDEALRQLLVRELPVKKNEVEISFDQPKREWSARLSRPTLNLFLYDMRENAKLRGTQPVWENARDPKTGAVTQKRRPMRVDLRYLVSAWTNEAEDEHRLLTRALLAFMRYAQLPNEVLPEALRSQPVPIPVQVAQAENLPNTSDVWSALENTLRAAIVLQVTLALDPYTPVLAGPPIRTRELRFGQAAAPEVEQVLAEPTDADVFWTVGGTVRAKKGTPANIQLRLLERDEAVAVSPDGRFAIGRLAQGHYTLRLSADQYPAREHKIKVPAPDYDLML